MTVTVKPSRRQAPDLRAWKAEVFDLIEQRMAMIYLGTAEAAADAICAEAVAWRECARYDPDMSGKKRFKGWDRSALDRCRKRFIEGEPHYSTPLDAEIAARTKGETNG